MHGVEQVSVDAMILKPRSEAVTRRGARTVRWWGHLGEELVDQPPPMNPVAEHQRSSAPRVLRLVSWSRVGMSRPW
jgi:hypothetical protein